VALPPEVQVALYRITQEALNNVAKHAVGAGASGAHVTLRWREEGVELEVVDDGKGFDAAAVGAGRLGLVGMRERAAAVGANLRVESGEGRGTRVAVRWEAAGAGLLTSSR
jgi:signal transduction histidine kinase